MSQPNLRSVVYVRTSIFSPFPGEVSLFRQQDAIARFCDMRGLELVERFKEPNRSGTDEDRPVFGRLIAAATARDRQFDLIMVASASRFSLSLSPLEAYRRRLERVIVMHSASRFFRDVFQFEGYRRKLKRARVTLAAVTQAIEGDEPMAAMTRHILTGFDEYQNAETGKHPGAPCSPTRKRATGTAVGRR